MPKAFCHQACLALQLSGDIKAKHQHCISIKLPLCLRQAEWPKTPGELDISCAENHLPWLEKNTKTKRNEMIFSILHLSMCNPIPHTCKRTLCLSVLVHHCFIKGLQKVRQKCVKSLQNSPKTGQKGQNFPLFMIKKYAGLKKVHYRRLWWLWLGALHAKSERKSWLDSICTDQVNLSHCMFQSLSLFAWKGEYKKEKEYGRMDER